METNGANFLFLFSNCFMLNWRIQIYSIVLVYMHPLLTLSNQINMFSKRRLQLKPKEIISLHSLDHHGFQHSNSVLFLFGILKWFLLHFVQQLHLQWPHWGLKYWQRGELSSNRQIPWNLQKSGIENAKQCKPFPRICGYAYCCKPWWRNRFMLTVQRRDLEHLETMLNYNYCQR